eukprot:PhF_6_TR5235/c0_g1_i1/m.7580/K13698/ABHD4; abhydrolase domain-containing protein 4
MSAPKTQPEDSESHARPYRESWYHWVPTSSKQLENAERDMLKPIQGSYTQTVIAGLNTIYYIHPKPTGPPLVLLHGFAGGCALWVSNWKKLCEHHSVYAVDLPGFARSARTPYKGSSPEASIDYFVDKIHEWVLASTVPTPFNLCGHSLGGYISSHFVFKYPALVLKLTLADPWGVPKEPKRKLSEYPWKWRAAASVIGMMNPLALMRGFGPWAPDTFAQRRPDIADKYRDFFEDPATVPDYIFHCNAGDPAGESAFYQLYHGMAWPRRPLETEMTERLPEHVRVLMVYGNRTWMDSSAGRRVAEALGPDRCVFEYVTGAGHNVFSDNYEEFNQILL